MTATTKERLLRLKDLIKRDKLLFIELANCSKDEVALNNRIRELLKLNATNMMKAKQVLKVLITG
jgi:hypothetical protein